MASLKREECEVFRRKRETVMKMEVTRKIGV